jgi:hypothetical protein
MATSIEKEMIIAVKPLHANTDPAIRCNFESDSNVIDVSDMQWEKHALQSISIQEVIRIAVKPLDVNADSAIRGNFESESSDLIANCDCRGLPEVFTSAYSPDYFLSAINELINCRTCSGKSF